MRLQNEYYGKPGYLLVIVSGLLTDTDAVLKLNEMRDEAEARNINRLLLDLRAMQMPPSEFTRYVSGEHLAKVLRPPIKVAAFAKPEIINHFAENTAVNRGAWFKIFTEETQAIEWLLEGL